MISGNDICRRGWGIGELLQEHRPDQDLAKESIGRDCGKLFI
jgi:hypothetical protein